MCPATPRHVRFCWHRCVKRAARVTTPAMATHCHGRRTPRVTMPSWRRNRRTRRRQRRKRRRGRRGRREREDDEDKPIEERRRAARRRTSSAAAASAGAEKGGAAVAERDGRHGRDERTEDRRKHCARASAGGRRRRGGMCSGDGSGSAAPEVGEAEEAFPPGRRLRNWPRPRPASRELEIN